MLSDQIGSVRRIMDSFAEGEVVTLAPATVASAKRLFEDFERQARMLEQAQIAPPARTIVELGGNVVCMVERRP